MFQKAGSRILINNKGIMRKFNEFGIIKCTYIRARCGRISIAKFVKVLLFGILQLHSRAEKKITKARCG